MTIDTATADPATLRKMLEEIDRVSAQLTAVRSEFEKLRGDLTAMHSLLLLANEREAMLTAELAAMRAQRDRLQVELDAAIMDNEMLRRGQRL